MGSVFGVRHSLKYLIGIIVGTTVVLVAVATRIPAALVALPAIGSVLLGISAAYILWLAYHIATAPLLSEQTAAPSFAGGALLGVAERGGRPPCPPSPAGSRSSLSPAIARANYPAIGPFDRYPIAPGSNPVAMLLYIDTSERSPRERFATRRGL